MCSFGEEIRLPLTRQLAGVGASRSGHFPFCAVGPFSFLCLAAFVLRYHSSGAKREAARNNRKGKIKYFDLNIQFHLALCIELSTVWRCVHEIFKEKRHLLQETLAGWLENQEPELLSISSLQGCFQN